MSHTEFAGCIDLKNSTLTDKALEWYSCDWISKSSYLPQLEVHWQVPFVVETLVARMCPQPLHACLGTTLPLKLTHKIHADSVSLHNRTETRKTTKLNGHSHCKKLFHLKNTIKSKKCYCMFSLCLPHKIHLGFQD